MVQKEEKERKKKKKKKENKRRERLIIIMGIEFAIGGEGAHEAFAMVPTEILISVEGQVPQDLEKDVTVSLKLPRMFLCLFLFGIFLRMNLSFTLSLRSLENLFFLVSFFLFVFFFFISLFPKELVQFYFFFFVKTSQNFLSNTNSPPNKLRLIFLQSIILSPISFLSQTTTFK